MTSPSNILWQSEVQPFASLYCIVIFQIGWLSAYNSEHNKYSNFEINQLHGSYFLDFLVFGLIFHIWIKAKCMVFMFWATACFNLLLKEIFFPIFFPGWYKTECNLGFDRILVPQTDLWIKTCLQDIKYLDCCSSCFAWFVVITFQVLVRTPTFSFL